MASAAPAPAVTTLGRRRSMTGTVRWSSENGLSFSGRCAGGLVADAAAAGLTSASIAHRSSRTDDRIVGTHAGALGYEIYLPAGYETSGLRYPVVYFLHGLPAGSSAFRQFGWLDEALDGTGKPAILVVPQAASGSHTDPEYLGRWETAIAGDIPRVVDAHYRTIPFRSGRAIIGLSAGGYGAMHLAL